MEKKHWDYGDSRDDVKPVDDVVVIEFLVFHVSLLFCWWDYYWLLLSLNGVTERREQAQADGIYKSNP